MALTQRKDSKENPEHQDIQAPQVHQEQPEQPQQAQQQEQAPLVQQEQPVQPQQGQAPQAQLEQQEQTQQAQQGQQPQQSQQGQEEQPQQFEQPAQQENSNSSSSAVPAPSKEQLLLKMLQDYKSHLSPVEKPKIATTTTNPEAELPAATEEKISSAPASTSPAPVAIDQLTARKMLALDDLTNAANNLIEHHEPHKLYRAFGAYEQALEKVRGWNPATGIGLKYTHGKKLVLGIRKLFPEIDNEAAYLAGKTMQVLYNYLIAKHQDVHAVDAEQEAKKISVEDKLITQCRELFLALEEIDYDDHEEILSGLQEKLNRTAILYELVYKFNSKNTGFIASVTSKLTTIPEDQLLIDLNSVKEKHEELFVNKKVPQL